MRVLARAPGRVNLIGDHTDYTGGFVLPMAIDLVTEVELDRGVPWIELVSADEDDPTLIDFAWQLDPSRLRPEWARYVGGVAAAMGNEVGGVGFVRTKIPIGGGLSSSAALEVAVALALGFEGTPLELALLCQRAEQMATGVPCGIMDQLASAAGVEGHALLIDCTALTVTPVPVPPNVEILVVDSGQRRSLANSFYGVRRAQCEEAADLIGPLREATLADVEAIGLADLRRRARHVVSENQRVIDFTTALSRGDLAAAGSLMVESHESLRDDFEVSTRPVDDLVAALVETPGVYGARMTGGGFGGYVVVLAERAAEVDGLVMRPSGPATVEILD